MLFRTNTCSDVNAWTDMNAWTDVEERRFSATSSVAHLVGASAPEGDANDEE